MVKNGFNSTFEDLGLFELFSYASQLAYFGFFWKESVVHEMEKASCHPKNSEKDVRDLMARSGSQKR